MEFLGFGTVGAEMPGMVDADGCIRDQSAHVADIGGNAFGADELARLSRLEMDALPRVDHRVRIGPNDSVIISCGSVKTDWDVALGLVVGHTTRYVGEAEAMDYVVGCAVINDVSERAFQLERGGQWDKGSARFRPSTVSARSSGAG